MNSIEKYLVKLFSGKDADVYLGNVKPTKQSHQTQKSKFNIWESIDKISLAVYRGFKWLFVDNLLSLSSYSSPSKKQKQLENERKIKKLKAIQQSRKLFPPPPPRNPYMHNTGSQSVIDRSQYDKVAKQVWDDNIDRPGLDVGREYLQNIKKAVVRQQAQPNQITETLFRETFRKKNFSETTISILWSEYNTWIRSYKSSYHGRYIQ